MNEKRRNFTQKASGGAFEVAYTRDIVTFSDFLNLNELNILHTTPKELVSRKV